MDEVGRGALAGPVTVGVVVVGAGTDTAPRGLRDSKLLTPAARDALVPALRGWGVARGVGHASAAEIDRLGIVPALRLAGRRALAACCVRPDVVVLDGSHDWLSAPGGGRGPLPGALALPGLPPVPAPDGAAPDGTGPGGGAPDGTGPGGAAPDATGPGGAAGDPEVVTVVRADRTCASVAAASVLAKVERDALLVALAREHPGYGWEGNKGYGSPDHLGAIARLGPCAHHRRTWRLPTPALAPAADQPSPAAGPLPTAGSRGRAVVQPSLFPEAAATPGGDPAG